MRSFVFVALLVVFVTPASPSQARRRTTPNESTAACGSDVKWLGSLEEAIARARTVGRPIFWYVPSVNRSPMDRKDLVDLYMRAGVFSMPEVVALLNGRFVPVRQVAKGTWQSKHELVRGKFIEPGFLVLDAGGKELFRSDKITTQSGPWFLHQLRAALVRAGDLSKDSDAVKEARGSADATMLAEALAREGDPETLEILARLEASDRTRVIQGRALIQASRAQDALSVLLAVEDPALTPETEKLLGLAHLALGKPKEALTHLAKTNFLASGADRQALFLGGVCHHLLNDRDQARKLWESLAKGTPADLWSRKAHAELQGLGPFARAFEEYSELPADALRESKGGTRVARTEQDHELVARRSVQLLLNHQRQDGGWDDSNYDFGGTDSLPNVYVAGTALAALALYEWHGTAPAPIDRAIERALDYLLNDRHIAWNDDDEIVWAHAYRLLLFQRLEQDERYRARCRKGSLDIVRHLLKSQLASGGWAHEYPNPFATASVLHVLSLTQQSGIPIGSDVLEKGSAALLKARGDDGTFSYGFGTRSGGAVQGAGGRMPLCELALLVCGKSDQPKLQRAIETSFAQHEHLERVRKYDDHADQFGNGGFFFWYDMFGRMAAINALENPELKAALRVRLRHQVFDITEIDGSFVDSHELGKTYGTAMGLITLKGTSTDG